MFHALRLVKEAFNDLKKTVTDLMKKHDEFDKNQYFVQIALMRSAT